jgi:hypothetical protein
VLVKYVVGTEMAQGKIHWRAFMKKVKLAGFYRRKVEQLSAA